MNNELNKHTTMPQILYVDLDVHKDSITIAVAPEDRDGAQLIGKFPNNITTLQRHFPNGERDRPKGKPSHQRSGLRPGRTQDRLRSRAVRLQCSIDASPVASQAYDCQVVAPSLIPQSAGDRVKTDKRDTKKLAIHHRAGQLTAVYVPHEADEAIRDLCRARSDATSKPQARHNASKPSCCATATLTRARPRGTNPT
ncbi:MAG: hypothetical protein R3F19_11690 [Verrucomicrobiales bacterium]